MADVNCNTEMTKYHADKVTLSKADQDSMRARRDAGRTRLNNGLKRDGHAMPAEQETQGSYAMRTMVQDAQCDYDIDDGAYFSDADLKNSDGVDLAPRAARERVCVALKQDDRLKHDAVVKDNCVRQPYPEGYHIDIPVYRIVRSKNSKGDEVNEYELASGDTWVKSDARAVTRWFNNLVGELNAGQSDGSQMRRVTKLTKKLARSRLSWKTKTTSGICITKLVVDHFVASADRDDKSLRETWKLIKAALDVSLRIEHPTLVGQTLADEGDDEVAFFRDCLSDALSTLEDLDAQDCDRTKARRTWDRVFNSTFFSDQPTDSGSASKNTAPFVVTSPSVARREDGGRRFG